MKPGLRLVLPLLAVAGFLSLQDDERYQRLLASARLVDLGRQLGAEGQWQGLTEEKLLEELRSSRAEAFQEMYAKATHAKS